MIGGGGRRGGVGKGARPLSVSEDNNTDNSTELLEQASEFLLNSPEKNTKKNKNNKGSSPNEKDTISENSEKNTRSSESEWTTVVSKRNHLYLDTSKMNTKTLGEDRQQQASPVALSPMTKVIREAKKFVSRNGRNDAENNNATTNNNNNNNGKGKSNRNLDFDSATNNTTEEEWQQPKSKRKNNITSPPPKVKMHQKKIELQDDDYFSESGGTPSPSAGRKNQYFSNKKVGSTTTTTKKANGSKENEHNQPKTNNNNENNNKTVTFNTTATTIAPSSLSSSSAPGSEPAFATRGDNKGRSAVSFQNLSRQSSVDQMEAMFSPSDASDTFGMPSPSGSMSNLFAESGDEGDELSQRGKKLGKHVKIMRKESISQIDSILEGEEYDRARHDDEDDDDSDEDDDDRSETSFDSDRQRRKTTTSSRSQGAKGGGFGSPFKMRNKAFANDADDSEGERKEAGIIDTKMNNDENLDELYALKDKVTEKFFAYKNKPDFTLQQAQEMLKKAEELLAGDAKSALEIDQRLMLLEQELREMRQDATIFFYGVGGIFLAWTVVGYVWSFFG
ncbi:unnamed protein product [Bathycoccus prasinos]